MKETPKHPAAQREQPIEGLYFCKVAGALSNISFNIQPKKPFEKDEDEMLLCCATTLHQ
jgi:hypothetical protein